MTDSECPRCGHEMTWTHCDGEADWVCNGANGCGYNT